MSSDQHHSPRRQFLVRGGLAALGAAALGLAGVLGLNLRPRSRRQRWVQVGRPEDFVPGSWRSVSGQEFFLVMTGQGLAAISARCTHLGCSLRHSGQGFSCPCHGGHFSADGRVLTGPPTRDLPWFAIVVDGGWVYVDPGHEVPAQQYQPLLARRWPRFWRGVVINKDLGQERRRG